MSEERAMGMRWRSREEADRLVGEFEASGLSRKEFSEQRGLALGTLDLYRKRRRQSQEAAKPGKRLVEVEVCGSEAAAESSSLLVVLVRGLRIEVGRGFDGATLERLVSVLEGR